MELPTTKEYELLKKIWMTASDYSMGLTIPEFAEEHGGIQKLLSDMREAIAAYEDY